MPLKRLQLLKEIFGDAKECVTINVYITIIFRLSYDILLCIRIFKHDQTYLSSTSFYIRYIPTEILYISGKTIEMNKRLFTSTKTKLFSLCKNKFFSFR